MGLSTAGAAVFARACASCHTPEGIDGLDPRAPKLETLRQYPPERIHQSLTTGLMQVQGAALAEPERREVSEWLSARYLGAAEAGDAAAMPNRCRVSPNWRPSGGWNGWSPKADNARFQAAGGLTAAELAGLKLKWAFGFPGGVQMFSQPSVAGGRLFVGGDTGQVYALDAATGCVHWSFLAQGAVRTAPVVGEAQGRPAIFVGDLKANLYAIDARDGRLIWQVKADAQPLARITGSPALHQGRLYVPIASSEEGSARMVGFECCRHRGSVVAVEAATGREVWRTYMVPDEPKLLDPWPSGRRRWGPAGGGVWTTPTVDAKRRRLYVTTGDAYAAPASRYTDAIVALDLSDGRIAWAHQDVADDVWIAACADGGEGCPNPLGPDFDFAASAMLQALPGGREVVVSGHKGGVAMAVDPDRNGAVVWRLPMSPRAPSTRGDIGFGAASDGRDAYFALQETGIVAALDLATGARRWATVARPKTGWSGHPGPGAAVTAVPGALLLAGWDGMLRAVSSRDGAELWAFDTARGFETVNGVAGRGGSMGGPGPVVAQGMVFVASGYVGVSNGTPGNVLLAFGR